MKVDFESVVCAIAYVLLPTSGLCRFLLDFSIALPEQEVAVPRCSMSQVLPARLTVRPGEVELHTSHTPCFISRKLNWDFSILKAGDRRAVAILLELPIPVTDHSAGSFFLV